MRSVIAIRARSFSAALVLTVLAAPLVIGTQPAAGGDDKRPAKSLPPELAKAIRDGDLRAVRAQLDGGVDVNARDADGNTPLLLAAIYAGPECVELLLKKGADVNASNKLGATPLIRAATNYEEAKLLIDAGADVKVKTKHPTEPGRTPLTLAARKYGNSKTVKLLLSKGADAKERNNRGVNPIQVAAACGDLDTVKLLVEAGADVNDFTAVPGLGAFSVRTPLGWAAYHNDVPMVRYLLERKADPNQATPLGTPLTWAARGNSAQAAEVLLAHGARTDVKSGDGTTPLHWAVGSDSSHPELVKLLLKNGADPNAEFGEQFDKFLGVAQTPRLIAEKRGQTALVEALVAVGAKTPPKARPAQRPLKPVGDQPDAERIRGSAESAVRLLQESAVVSSESAHRHTTLKHACLTCHQHFLPLAAMTQAKDRAVRLDRDAVTRLGDQVAAGFPGIDIAEVDLFADPATSLGYRSFGLIGDHRPANATTDQWMHSLVVIQAGDGRWPAFAPRPPMQVSDVSSTALVVQAIKHYGWAGRKAEFDAAVNRARKWLWTVKAETTEDAVYQLLGLHWAGKPGEELAGLAKALLSLQRKDGGWAQLPKLESDAYATGQALYALSRAVKHPTMSRDWQQGLRFLLGTQCDDGSWHVVSRAYPFQPHDGQRLPPRARFVDLRRGDELAPRSALSPWRSVASVVSKCVKLAHLHRRTKATTALRPHSSASFMSVASSTQKPPMCSLVSRYGPSVMSTLPPGCARSDFALFTGCRPPTKTLIPAAIISSLNTAGHRKRR
jgi:ankyrin repeat protein